MKGGVIHARTPAVAGDDQAEDGGGKKLGIVALDALVTAAVQSGWEGADRARVGAPISGDRW